MYKLPLINLRFTHPDRDDDAGIHSETGVIPFDPNVKNRQEWDKPIMIFRRNT